MAHIDRIWDRLKERAETTPTGETTELQTDALTLWEAFRETHRAETLAPTDVPLADWKAAENAAHALRIALQTKDREKTMASIRTMQSACTQCHKAYR